MKTWAPGNFIEVRTNNGAGFDAVLDKYLREKHSEWWPYGRRQNKDRLPTDEAKRLLLEMPPGSPRPPKRWGKDLREYKASPGYDPRALGSCLGHYTDKGHPCYDPEFDRAIREKQPQWWPVDELFKQLLEMPIGSKKPSCKTPLGSRIRNMVRSATLVPRRGAKRMESIMALKEKFPDWFSSKGKTYEENRDELLAIPRGDFLKPNSALGKFFRRHCLPGVLDANGREFYKPELAKVVAEKHPEWFGIGRLVAARRPRRPSPLNDVARKASVSTTTVWYALRHDPRCKEKTAKRIRKIAEIAGYVVKPRKKVGCVLDKSCNGGSMKSCDVRVREA